MLVRGCARATAPGPDKSPPHAARRRGDMGSSGGSKGRIRGVGWGGVRAGVAKKGQKRDNASKQRRLPLSNVEEER